MHLVRWCKRRISHCWRAVRGNRCRPGVNLKIATPWLRAAENHNSLRVGELAEGEALSSEPLRVAGRTVISRQPIRAASRYWIGCFGQLAAHSPAVVTIIDRNRTSGVA
jgi:hypothetical protein